MMRILWVKMGGLWPPTSGGRTRSLKLITELSRRHDVTVVTTHGEGDDPAGLADTLPRCSRVISFEYQVPKRGSRLFPLTVARSWLAKEPVDLWKWRVADVASCARGLMASGHVDVCVADFLFAVTNVPLGQSTPVVLFEHNVEYLIWKRLYDVETSPWKKALLAVEWRKLRAREAAACRRADLTIAVSSHDPTASRRSRRRQTLRGFRPESTWTISRRRWRTSGPITSCSAVRWIGIPTKTRSATS
jgi:hypothetical protein